MYLLWWSKSVQNWEKKSNIQHQIDENFTAGRFHNYFIFQLEWFVAIKCTYMWLHPTSNNCVVNNVFRRKEQSLIMQNIVHRCFWKMSRLSECTSNFSFKNKQQQKLRIESNTKYKQKGIFFNGVFMMKCMGVFRLFLFIYLQFRLWRFFYFLKDSSSISEESLHWFTSLRHAQNSIWKPVQNDCEFYNEIIKSIQWIAWTEAHYKTVRGYTIRVMMKYRKRKHYRSSIYVGIIELQDTLNN